MQSFGSIASVITNTISDEVELHFCTNSGSTQMSLMIFLFGKNQLAQSSEQHNATLPGLTIPMKNNGFGEFEATVSMKQIIKAFFGGSSTSQKKRETQEEERECNYERQLYESLQNFENIHYVFEADNKQLQTDRFQTQKQTANCLGPIAFRALGRLDKVNERNIECEVQEAMKPLVRKLENEGDSKGKRVLNLKDFQNGKEDALLDMLKGKKISYDMVSETDSTTHSSDVGSRMDLDMTQESDEGLEIASQMSETDIDNLQIKSTDLKVKVPEQFQGTQNKWQKKRNQLVLQALMMQKMGKPEMPMMKAANSATPATAATESEKVSTPTDYYYSSDSYYSSSTSTDFTKKEITPIISKPIIICVKCKNNNNNNNNNNCVDCNLLQLQDGQKSKAGQVTTTTTTTTTTTKATSFKSKSQFRKKDKKAEKTKKRVTFIEDVAVEMPVWPPVPVPATWPLAADCATKLHHHHHHHNHHVVVGNVVGGVCF